MKTAILGTGTVGRTIAARLAGLGHTVTIGTRNPEITLARAEPDAMGTAPFAAWIEENPGITLAGFAHAAVGAEIIVNAASRAFPWTSSPRRGPRTSTARSSSTSPIPSISARACRLPCS